MHFGYTIIYVSDVPAATAFYETAFDSLPDLSRPTATTPSSTPATPRCPSPTPLWPMCSACR